jgi:3-oxoacyl-[acyl-carrier-protein] synthase-1/3-oxoacyl-[acyl-carrier-protein] synthase II
MQVAITGLGIHVPGYTQAQVLFDDLYQGESLLRQYKPGKTGSLTSVIASPVSDDELSTLDTLFPQLASPTVSKATKMALFAANQAVNDAKLDIVGLGKRVGLFLAINKNGINPDVLPPLWDAINGRSLSAAEKETVDNEVNSLNIAQTTAFIAKNLNITGLAMTHSDACTAGAIAIISAQRRILAGEIDVAICGGTEHGTNPMMQLVFNKLGALCQTKFNTAAETSRPFDKNRAGCVLADGSAFLVLESIEHAKKRGVKPIAFLQGSSRQSEAYRPTSTNSDGSLYVDCIKNALKNAELSADNIMHINAHGTSTISNDQAESRAIDNLFPHKPRVTSTKSALGHSLAASGAIEAVLSVLSLKNQKVLPTLNFTEGLPDEPELNISPNGKVQEVDYLLSNSFGFGGENACLIFAKELSNECS